MSRSGYRRKAQMYTKLSINVPYSVHQHNILPINVAADHWPFFGCEHCHTHKPPPLGLQLDPRYQNMLAVTGPFSVPVITLVLEKV
jgi:hypothetical protein